MLRPRPSRLRALALALLVFGGSAGAAELDLAGRATDPPGLLRLHGSTGDGSLGVAVAGGRDSDGDGHPDFALASMLASPQGVQRAGSVYLLFGDGSIAGTFDTATASPRVLRIDGGVPLETAGNEIWIDDVTGDGLGDLLIGRQNFGTGVARGGTGALSIVPGSAALRALAADGAPLRLEAPPPPIPVLTIVGAQVLGRFGIWMRTGDIDGDGVADLVVGADQEQHDTARHAGAVYVIRGGPHLGGGGRVDLAAAQGTPLDGHFLRITPPPGAAEFHAGATCQIADLDGNGRGEVLFAAALNRAGATLPALGGGAGSAHGIGGSARGTLFIAWDDSFPAGRWDTTTGFRFDQGPGGRTTIRGGVGNESFGEEILGGLDFDGDGRAELFVGDISGDLSPERNRDLAGAGFVFWDAASLRDRDLDLETPPEDVAVTLFLGAAAGDIAADTGAQGDFDGDGRSDLAFSAPHHAALGRASAGIVYVFFGQAGRWPEAIDLRALPAGAVRTALVYGARGSRGADSGDTLAYSAATVDADGDGREDLVLNEMEGNGLAPGSVDDGNLVVVSGALLGGQEPGDPCPPVPRAGCRTAAPGGSQFVAAFGDAAAAPQLRWRWGRGAATTTAELGDPAAGATAYALCLYDAAAAAGPALQLRLPPADDCADAACWRPPGTRGPRFRSANGLPDGIRRAALRSGREGTAAIEVRAAGAHLALPRPLQVPLTVQLLRRDAPVCWESRFRTALTATAQRLATRGP